MYVSIGDLGKAKKKVDPLAQIKKAVDAQAAQPILSGEVKTILGLAAAGIVAIFVIGLIMKRRKGPTDVVPAT